MEFRIAKMTIPGIVMTASGTRCMLFSSMGSFSGLPGTKPCKPLPRIQAAWHIDVTAWQADPGQLPSTILVNYPLTKVPSQSIAERRLDSAVR